MKGAWPSLQTWLASVSPPWLSGKSAEMVKAQKRVFEPGRSNRDTGRTGRVTMLSLAVFSPWWSQHDNTGAAEANSLRQPDWPQKLSVFLKGNWKRRSDYLGFFDPGTDTSKTPCSFLKARQKQKTPSTESQINLGLDETLRGGKGVTWGYL